MYHTYQWYENWSHGYDSYVKPACVYFQQSEPWFALHVCIWGSSWEEVGGCSWQTFFCSHIVWTLLAWGRASYLVEWQSFRINSLVDGWMDGCSLRFMGLSKDYLSKEYNSWLTSHLRTTQETTRVQGTKGGPFRSTSDVKTQESGYWEDITQEKIQ